MKALIKTLIGLCLMLPTCATSYAQSAELADKYWKAGQELAKQGKHLWKRKGSPLTFHFQGINARNATLLEAMSRRHPRHGEAIETRAGLPPEPGKQSLKLLDKLDEVLRCLLPK